MRCLAVALLLATFAAAQANSFNPADPAPTQGTEGSVKIAQLGPFTIPAGQIIGGQMVPGDWENIVAVPSTAHPGDVWMTGFDNRIVDTNRVPQNPALLYLHHAVFVKVLTPDRTCTAMPGERFVASGAERIPLALPGGYGYRIRSNDLLAVLLHMQNFTTQPQTVYYQFSMVVQPGTASLTHVQPIWLDVVNCTSSYTVTRGSGTHVKTANHQVTAAMRNLTFLTVGPHLHCGGIQLDIINANTSQTIWSFTNSACPVQMQASILNPPVYIPVGTTLTISATYQRDPINDLDAMGIMIGYAIQS